MSAQSSTAPSSRLTTFQHCLIVLGGFICYFLADGYTYSIGVLYAYFLTAFETSGTSTSLLPGLLYAIPQFTAPILCPLLDTFGYSSGAGWAALLLCVSCIASAFAPNLGTLYFTMGFLTSVGLQLTYTSAIMAVTTTFKQHRLFGLALGLTMCGSGLGSFLSSPLLDYLLTQWSSSWRHVALLQAAILLHTLVAAACFHHLDARLWRPASDNTLSINDDDSVEPVDNCSNWTVFRFFMLIPSRFRFKADPGEKKGQTSSLIVLPTTDCMENTSSSWSSDFLTALRVSLGRLASHQLWTNPTFLAYIGSNALQGASVVIPWTFVYDHVLLLMARRRSESAGQASQLVSLIGIGSLAGQIIVGLLTSQFGDLSISRRCCCCQDNSDHRHQTDACSDVESSSPPNRSCCRRAAAGIKPSSFRMLLYLGVLAWSAVSTFGLAQATQSLLVAGDDDANLLDLPAGRLSAFLCFLIGLSNGGLYVLYPQMLIDCVGEELWPAGLALYLLLNGAMNLIGTTLGGWCKDAYGDYHLAFLLAGSLSITALFLMTGQQFVSRRRSTMTNAQSRRPEDDPLTDV